MRGPQCYNAWRANTWTALRATQHVVQAHNIRMYDTAGLRHSSTFKRPSALGNLAEDDGAYSGVVHVHQIQSLIQAEAHHDRHEVVAVRLAKSLQLWKRRLVQGLKLILKVRERRCKVDAYDVGRAHAALCGVERAVQPRKSVEPRRVLDALVFWLDANVDVQASGDDFQLALARVELKPLLEHGFKREVGQLDFDLPKKVVLAEERDVVVEELNDQHARRLADFELERLVPLRVQGLFDDLRLLLDAPEVHDRVRV